MEITSLQNELIKNAVKLQQKKYRKESKKFLLEGFKCIQEALDSGIVVEQVFVEKTKINTYKNFPNIIETTPSVLKKISTTESAPEIIGIGVQKEYNESEFGKFKKVILLEGIKDAGNLGTILRSAVAFDAEGVVLYGDCIDLYNPKVVRSSVGNLWKIPVISISDLDKLKSIFKSYTKVSTLPRAKTYLKSYKVQYPVLLMFGSESDGLSEELIKIATEELKIEMNPKVESLNLATSVSVMMYELFIKK